MVFSDSHPEGEEKLTLPQWQGFFWCRRCFSQDA